MSKCECRMPRLEDPTTDSAMADSAGGYSRFQKLLITFMFLNFGLSVAGLFTELTLIKRGTRNE